LFIAKDSHQQADIIFDKLVNSTLKLEAMPYRYPPDKYKTDNDGRYRAYELFHYRISYKITDTTIYILRVRSTYRNPKTY